MATEIKRGGVGAVLSRLEERSFVRHQGWYWAIAEDDRLASYAAQTQASSASTNDNYYDEGWVMSYERGAVVKCPDLFGGYDHRPYVCVSDESHPFVDK